jgi:hypothetical protein
MAGGGALPADTAGIVCPMRAVLPRDAERGAARHERVPPGSRLLAALCLVAALAVWLPLPAWLAGPQWEDRPSPALTAVDAAADCAPVHAQLPAGMAASQNAVGRRAAALHRGTALALTAHGAERGRRPGAVHGPESYPAAWATRSIECLQPGETVLAWDPATRRVRPQRIEATFVRTTRRLRVLEIADGRGEVQTLHTTDEHPFWSVDRRQFVAAGELHPGEGLLGCDGGLLTLRGSRVEHHPRGITVYNFRVAHDHTYFAAATPASAPLLVHNADGCENPPTPDPHRNAPPDDVGAPGGINSGASNVNAAEALRAKLAGLEEAQQTAAKTRTLQDGRIRYYRPEKPARSAGPTRGASFVTEWDPKTGTVRQWMESYDHAGNVIRVHPKNINGQQIIGPHYPPTVKELGQ